MPSPKAEPVNSGLETTPDVALKQEAIETKSKVGRAVETTVGNIFRGTVDRVELLRRTFGSEIVCPHCGGAIRLMALVKTERTKAIASIAETILFGMGFLTVVSTAWPAESDCFNRPMFHRPIASIARCFIGEASPLKLKEEVDLEWSEEPQEWAD